MSETTKTVDSSTTQLTDGERSSHPSGFDGPEERTESVLAPAPLTNGPAEKFLRALWGAGSDPGGKLGICSWKPSFSNRWFDISEDGIKSAAANAIELGEDVYFHCASHDVSKTTRRGSRDSASMFPCLWADIDVAEAGKNNGKNYPSKELATELLDKLPVPPSCIINSGNGLHAYWFLDEPVPFVTGPAERQLFSEPNVQRLSLYEKVLTRIVFTNYPFSDYGLD